MADASPQMQQPLLPTLLQRLAELAAGWERRAEDGFSGSPFGCAAQLREIIQAARGAQEEEVAGAAGGLRVRVGKLPTVNDDDYPALPDTWVQLWRAGGEDEVVARVYGHGPEETMRRAWAIADAIHGAPQSSRERWEPCRARHPTVTSWEARCCLQEGHDGPHRISQEGLVWEDAAAEVPAQPASEDPRV